MTESCAGTLKSCSTDFQCSNKIQVHWFEQYDSLNDTLAVKARGVFEMKKAEIDIAVLIIFFCRDEQLSEVFEQVKSAKPTKLYLYQDGARSDRESDKIGIEKCRLIVSDDQIDWECDVHRFYQNQNYGCDPSEFIAQKWMFKTEKMGIVLEDDDIPTQSFFIFCKQLLEKYANDNRINIICGMNNTSVSKHIETSYLFTKKGSIWGWASWKRVIDTWDETYSWLDEPDKLAYIKRQMSKQEFDAYIKTAKAHRATGRAHYESIMAASMYLNNQLNIVPKYNMIKNIGISQETTHSVNDIRLLPKRTQKLFFMKTYEIDFPLTHPHQVTRDYLFERKMTSTRTQLVTDRVERAFRCVRYQGLKALYRLIQDKISRRRVVNE